MGFAMYVYICIYDKRQREIEIEKTNEQKKKRSTREEEDDDDDDDDQAISRARSA